MKIASPQFGETWAENICHVPITIHITLGLNNEITAAAEELGISTGAFITMALARAVSERKGGKENATTD